MRTGLSNDRAKLRHAHRPSDQADESTACGVRISASTVQEPATTFPPLPDTLTEQANRGPTLSGKSSA
ncbi:hypothetical protein GCM10017600_46440 [Streptosporangium carneum]|uniref:Uncharacterized protein n=1 Tax=Streptosporangium carneum TaxID=47481 RepID=A0A9W6I3Y9_9ACTN|nr:hypothetical protein GCM10017600_46440 [Streptosporangium carneum]